MGSTSYFSVLFFVLCFIFIFFTNPSTAFNCTSTRTKCQSLVDYVSPNKTTLSSIETLFGVKKLHNLLGVNNLPISTLSTYTIAAKQKIRIPFDCLCTNGLGLSNHLPIYKVIKNDGLDHIAKDVFSALVTYQQIAKANRIPDPNKIFVGQELWIPLPCSCDDVDELRVVHYGHVVENGSSVGKIAQAYGTTEDTLLKINGMANSSDLLKGQILDVPLRACSSSIKNESPDNSLLLSNGTYAVTAHDCVKCNCNFANNWTLICEPSQLKPTKWSSCPSMKCVGSDNLYLGNTTSTGCNGTNCAYAGFSNTSQTILTAIVANCPAPAPNNNAGSRINLQALNWNAVFICIQLVLLSFSYFQ